MDKLFDNDTFTSRFDTWFDDRYGAFGPQTISVEDTGDSIVYELALGGKELVDLKVDVADAMVSIEAEMRSVDDNTTSVSTIAQHFPVPPQVDAQAFTIDQSDTDAVKIRFPKV